jgi:predicted Zn-dependent peptidase
MEINKTNSYKKITLKNGLTLILYPIKEVRSVYMVCGIRSANVFGKQEEIGISHFLEHLSFCSVDKFKTRKSISQALYDIGAHANAQTSNFQTSYWLKCPTVEIKNSIDIFHQLLFKSRITEKEVKSEKNVILNEFRDFEGNANSLFMHNIQKNRFKNLPTYQTKPMGNPKVIQSITVNSIKKWKNTFINPSNMILAITGNFIEKSTIEQIEKTFGKEKPGVKAEFPKFEDSEYSDFSIYNKQKEVNQVCFELTWPTIGWNETDRHHELVLQILNTILGSGPLSRLNLKLREEENIAYYIKSYLTTFPSLGYMGISGSVNIKDLLKSLKLVKKIISEIAKSGITSKELEQTKRYFEFQNLMNFETPESIANYLTGNLYDYGEIWTPEDYIRERSTIKKEEVLQMAKDILNFKKTNINLQGNVDKKTLKEIKAIFTL